MTSKINHSGCLRRRRPAKARACTAAGSRNASRLARIKERTGPRDLALCSWIWGCGHRRPATCQLAVHDSGPYVRAARQAADRDKRSMNRRPRHSPAHLQFRAGVSPRLTSDRCAPRGRQKIPGIPISPRGPACSHHSRVRGTSSCLSSVARWRGVWGVRKKRG